MNAPLDDETSQLRPQLQEPAIVQLDPKCLHSALKEFFEPLRSNDPRADFFAVYRKESDEFDRDYAKKYDEDLNTSLIFAGLFSAVSSAFIIDVQSKLERDPNEMAAAYLRILIHTMNSSLFPDANSDPITWTGPSPKIITVQSLLYASLATSLFAAFLAMLGKQWVNRYLRNRGGSAADKSRDRQRKLDGLENWHFHLVIESLPVMLQLALLLLGCALSLYLWTISCTVAGVVLAFTLFGVTSYVFFTLAATFYYNCPYQTPPSILIRTLFMYLSSSSSTLARSLRFLIKYLTSVCLLLVKNLRRILRRLSAGIPGALNEPSHTPHAAVVTSPTRIFEDILINWEVGKADARCICWVLDSTTDADIILSTVRFAADMILYPEIAGALSPHILADLFFDCILDGQVIPGKTEHASSIGMALASVLSIQLSMEPENQTLRRLCVRIIDYVQWVPSSELVFSLVVAVLKFVAQTPYPVLTWGFPQWWISESIPERLPTAYKLWLSRVILQTLWRWRRVQDPTTILHFYSMDSVCKRLMADGDESLVILKTNCFLIMAISLGSRIDIRDLYAPNNNDALRTATNLFRQQLQMSITEGKGNRGGPTWALSALLYLYPFQVMGTRELLWITKILNSGYPEDERYRMASLVVQLLAKHFYSEDLDCLPDVRPAWIPPLLGFLSLSEKFYTTESPPHSGFIALHILSTSPGYADFSTTLLPILASTLLPTHPLKSRSLALKIFVRFMSGWFSPQIESILAQDLGQFLQAVGDPFQFTSDLPFQDGQPVGTADYEPMMAAVVLIEFASSDLWRDHLRRSNFTSCEEIMSTEEGKRNALRCMFGRATHSWPKFLCTSTSIIAAIRRLEELRCPNTAEVVILWAWTIGVVDALDHDAWRLIGRDTLRFYQTHGTGRLATLKLHITDTTMEFRHIEFLIAHHEGSPCRVRSVRRPVLTPRPLWNDTDFCVSQACQSRRLCQLFGYDPTRWKEVVDVEEGGEVLDASSGLPVTPVQCMELACDYP